MFLGVFTSIIPYLLAAGLYGLYLVFSFAQPYFNKKTEEPVNPRVIEAGRESKFEKNTSSIDYEEAHDLNNEDKNKETASHAGLHPPTLIITSFAGPPGKSPGINTGFLHFIYSRPPPLC